MAATIRVNSKMKEIIKAFKSINQDKKWIQDLNDADCINCILNDWTRQNFTHKEADEILNK